jgi:hypothetical protein
LSAAIHYSDGASTSDFSGQVTDASGSYATTFSVPNNKGAHGTITATVAGHTCRSASFTVS